MPLQLNCKILPPSKAGPVALGCCAGCGDSPLELDGMEFKLLAAVCQLEPVDARDERVASMSEDSVGRELLAGETGVEHVGQLHGERE